MLQLAALPLAAASSIGEIPSEVWIRLGVAVAAIIVGVFVLRKLAGMNKVVLGVVVFVALTIVGFNWIYERNEPAWATPAVKWLAGFFPTKNPR